MAACVSCLERTRLIVLFLWTHCQGLSLRMCFLTNSVFWQPCDFLLVHRNMLKCFKLPLCHSPNLHSVTVTLQNATLSPWGATLSLADLPLCWSPNCCVMLPDPTFCHSLICHSVIPQAATLPLPDLPCHHSTKCHLVTSQAATLSFPDLPLSYSKSCHVVTPWPVTKLPQKGNSRIPWAATPSLPELPLRPSLHELPLCQFQAATVSLL